MKDGASGESMSVRKPAVAGMFYSGDPTGLREAVEHLVGERRPEVGVHGIVVPHAGYTYSGAVAAEAFRRLPETQQVILLGPAHHVGFSGAALDTNEAWETPLGTVELLAPEHLGAPFRRLPEAHAPEHSLEVQLPFLQVVVPDARILPVLVHDLTADEAERVARALLAAYPHAHWVVSTDLSHYHPRAIARQRDEASLRVLQECALEESAAVDACGRFPLLVAMTACRAQGWSMELLRYATSADAGGDASGVVGYAALRF